MSADEGAEYTPQGWHARMAGEYGPGGWPLNAPGHGAVVYSPIRSGAGSLYFLTGYNNGAACYIQLFDMIDQGSGPASGAVPPIVFNAPANDFFSLSYGIVGRAFKQGIVAASSSTVFTYTATAAQCSFDAQHA